MSNKKKLLAIASEGGHWIQLRRLEPAFEGMELIYASTNSGYSKMLNNNKFYKISDANRWNKLKLIKSFFEVRKIVRKEKPDYIISTGAAPGLFGIIAGKGIGARSIWLDSIANVEKLSMSGRIALKFAYKCFTQWEHLADNKTIYYTGTVVK